MSWIMIFVLLTVDGVSIPVTAEYNTMDECFEAREKIVKEWGRPSINYQVVCVAKDF